MAWHLSSIQGMTWHLSSIQSRKCTSQFYGLDLNNGPIFNHNGPTFFPIRFSASDSVKIHNGAIYEVPIPDTIWIQYDADTGNFSKFPIRYGLDTLLKN